jgi:CheY-like chemotaxis protein
VMEKDNRNDQRISVSFEVVWEASSQKQHARLSDISIGGCYVDTLLQATTGEMITFQVHLPTGHWVQMRGQVMHTHPTIGFGVRFVDLTPEERVLVEQVILAHGGEISASELPPNEAEAGAVGLDPVARRRVLVADDDPTIRHLVTIVVQREGYTVVAARDGREVFNILQTDTDFVAAIFDMMMPYIDGLDLVRNMRMESRLAHIPVGIMTAEQDPKLWEDSIDAGAGIFLPKPFTTTQLAFMLKVLVRQSNSHPK